MLTQTINIIFSIIPVSFILGNFALNLNIILIDVFFIFYVIKRSEWKWLKSINFKLLISLYIFLNINSFFNYFLNQDYGFDGVLRSLSFIKFLLLVFSLQYLILDNKQLEKIFKNWMIIVIIVIIDVFFERIFGQNMLGFKSLDTTRIVSFFYDENIVGAFLLLFSFIVCFFFLNKKLKKTKKIFINIIFFLIPLAVLISGERSNFIKCLILFSLILFFIKSNQLLISKFKVFILVLSMVFISIIVSPNIYIKQTEFFKRIFISNNAEKFLDRFQKITYLSHYDVAWEIFKDNPINGVGSKNFRIKCAEEKYFNTELLFSSKRCSTHPHQLHFELLSEQGIIGYLLFFYLALRFIFTNLSKSFESRNIFFTGINLYLLVFLIPLLPGGSIFSTLNGSLFWLIFALANMRFNKKILD